MFRSAALTLASLVSTGTIAALLSLSTTPAHAAVALPSYESFGKSAECVALRKQYPTLVGKHLKIGLGGYTAGFEAPAKDDPSKVEGLDPDLIAYMGACLGYTHEYQNVAFNVLLTGITGKRFDMGPSLYVTDVRRKEVAFVSSFAVVDGSVMKKGNPKHLSSLDTLCGATVAAAAGTYEAVTLVPQVTEKCKAQNKPEVGLLLLQATDASVQAVRSGRADIYLTAHSDAKALAASVPDLESGFIVDLPILNGFPIAKDNATLRGAVLASMKVIQDKGIEKSLLDKWGQDAASQRAASDAE